MICSYFGISFFEFAKNVYLQILYENIYRKKKLDMKYKVLKSSSGIVNPFDQAWLFPGVGRNARRLCRTSGNQFLF